MLRSKLPDVGTTIFTRMSQLANEARALNLSQGFPDFAPPPALLEAIAQVTRDGNNQYAPMAGVMRLREQIAQQLQLHRRVSADPDTEITVVPGATEGIFCAVMACAGPGDEVIVLDPCYDSYEPAIRLAGARAVHVPLLEDSFGVDWERVAGAITPRTRLLMLNSPHNPTGSVLGASDMAQLADLVERHQLLLISDEVYEHLIYDGRQHHSILQYPALRARSVAVFSFGKTYGVTGWKTGYCVAPAALTAELRKVHQFVCFVAVTPVQEALADFMAAEPEYPASLAAFYQAKRDLLCQALQPSAFRVKPSAGTYFQLLEYSALTRREDVAVAEDWTRAHKVASIPVSVFYERPPQAYYLRLCFAKRDDNLLEAADRLCRISL
ncbi:MAG: aminotransferase class I/II-fold pyridoxal phosphate-dependent enzyme [Halioglobus sp.]|nr:aminotransferase class I/II-fold pyridoxal phosphate-dependent enzyme [Halioglobus sp.]